MRKFMVGMGAVAGLWMVTGCKSERDAAAEARQELATAEQEAQKDLAHLRLETQKELARARSEGEQKAEDIRKAVAEKNAEVARLEQEASKDVAAASASPLLVAGALVSSTAGDFTLRSADGRELKLETDGQTRVRFHDRAVKLDTFKEGTQLRASYVKDGDDYQARDVTIITPVIE